MSVEIHNEIENIGGDLTKPEWQWFINNGPHGKDFTWSQTKEKPPGYVGIEHLERIIQDKIDIRAMFLHEAREVVGLALKSSNTNILLRAIQVSGVVGLFKELKTISGLVNHVEPVISNNAKACAFYLKKRLKSHTQKVDTHA